MIDQYIKCSDLSATPTPPPYLSLFLHQSKGHVVIKLNRIFSSTPISDHMHSLCVADMHIASKSKVAERVGIDWFEEKLPAGRASNKEEFIVLAARAWPQY